MRLKLLIPFLFFGFAAFSQKPAFTLSQTKGCVPFTVSVTGIPGTCTNPIYYLTTLSGTALIPGNLNPIITYNKPGIDKIYLQMNCITFATSDTATIEVLDTTKPAFVARTCTSDTVSLFINESKYDEYFIDWADGSSLQTVSGYSTTKHKYPNTLQRTVKVSGIYFYTVAGLGLQQCGNFSTQTIKPITNLVKANIQLLEVNTVSDTGKVSLTFSLSPDISYKVYQKTGYYTPFGPFIDTIVNQPGQQTRIFKNLNTASNHYCFYLSAYDYCKSATVDTDEICTMSISGIATLSNNELYWNKYPDPALYSLSVNGFSIPGAVLQPDTFYNDPNVQCKQVYCYKVGAGFGSFPPTTWSISAPVCITAIKPANFDVPKNFNATYANSSLTLFWDASTLSGIKYNVYTISSPTGSDTILSDITTTNSIKPAKQSSKCYALKIADDCGSSPLVRACPVNLTGHMDSEVQNSLQWPDGYTNGDSNPVTSYTIELYTDAYAPISSAGLGLSTQYIQNPIDTTNQKVIYRIKAVAGDTVVYSNYFSIIQTLRLFMPNAFTPNGDGLNESFLAYGLFFDTFEMKIYNRWGQTVFSSDDRSAGWDGGSNNPDIYHYYVKVTDKFGNDLVKKGTLYLMRQ